MNSRCYCCRYCCCCSILCFYLGILYRENRIAEMIHHDQVANSQLRVVGSFSIFISWTESARFQPLKTTFKSIISLKLTSRLTLESKSPIKIKAERKKKTNKTLFRLFLISSSRIDYFDERLCEAI